MSTSLLNRSQVRSEFQLRIEENPYVQLVDRLALRTRSTAASERYNAVSRAPVPARLLGSRRVKAMTAKPIDIANDEFASAIDIRDRDLRRDQSGELRRRMTDLAARYAAHPWRQISDLIKNGAVSGNNSYDGTTFFSTGHVFGDSGSQKNVLTSSEVASLDVTTANAPTPEEAVTAVLDSIGYGMGFVDDEGEPVLENARNWLVMCHFNLWGSLTAASKSNNLSGGETNTLTALSADGFNLSVVPNVRLYTPGTASAVMYLFNLDGIGDKPFIFQEEVPPEVDMKDEDSDYFKDTRSYQVGVYASNGTGYGEPLRALKCTFS